MRTVSSTSFVPGPMLTTQASNFSFFSRADASPEIITGSTPNCRKQSARMLRRESVMSTSATRAPAFLAGMNRGAIVDEVIAIFLSIFSRYAGRNVPAETLFWLGFAYLAKGRKANLRMTKDTLLEVNRRRTNVSEENPGAAEALFHPAPKKQGPISAAETERI